MSEGPLPRELVLASAGTGKTYHLSSRILGLVHDGAPPEEVLASTFTRKAAGEILDRVLSRLAGAGLDEDEADDLGRKALLGGAGGEEGFGAPEALALLEELAPRLHRFEIGTLDSVFVRACRSFWPELDLPPGWTIADEPTAARLRSEALQDVLGEGRREERVELVRMLVRGSASRRVHGRLMDQVRGLHRLWRQVDPEAESPWSPFDDRGGVEDPEAAREELASRVAAAELPKNSSGDPDGHWVNARDALVEELRNGDWEGVLGGGLGAGALDEGFEYYNEPPPAELRACLDEVRRLAAAELAPAFDAQARALGRLAERFDRAFRRRQREEGAYRFGDLTHRLAAGPGIALGGEAGFRLDRRVRHLLLDEFQDTSVPQWEALRPMADRLAARPAEESAAVVVADPKQSIYGWRDAAPSLVRRVGERYGLSEERLRESYRSSPVVLDFVADVFDDLPASPVLAEVDHGPDVARTWSEAFDRPRPASEREGDAGHVRLEVGPEDEVRGKAPPGMMAAAADRVAGLAERAPGASIGVLTSTNDAVAALIRELRARGIAASEEGGISVERSAPVAALLSLLRLADHPGDRVARYHVAATPLGSVVGYRDHRQEADRLSERVRERLVQDGYGATLARWRRELAGAVSDRQDRRLRQLVELGYRWDGRASLRATDFVRFVEAERVREPTSAAVRVMTVHQAKGLEFDVVVLPELDGPLAGWGTPGLLPERDPETGRVARVFPYVTKKLRPLFPELEEAYRQHRERRLRDALSALYVAVTRARRAVHVLVSASSVTSSTSAARPSRLMLAALGLHEREGEEGDVLLERGDPGWHRELEAVDAPPVTSRPETGGLRIDPGRSLGRMLPQSAPSDLEAGAGDLRERLRIGGGQARLEGTVVHAWLERVRWLEDGLPRDGRLRRIARREAPSLGEDGTESLVASFGRWLEAEEVRDALSRGRAAARARELAGADELAVEVQTEWAYLRRRGREVVSGQVDRLVLASRPTSGDPEGETADVLAAEVLDYKTDEVEGEDELRAAVERHRPQLEEYRRAAARLHGLPLERVSARIVFLAPGRVVEV